MEMKLFDSELKVMEVWGDTQNVIEES